MKINERKYTTERGLIELNNLINKLEEKLNGIDIDTIESIGFDIKYYHNNGLYPNDNNYQQYVCKIGYWVIEDNNIKLKGQYNYGAIWAEFETIDIEGVLDLKSIDFKAAIAALEDVLKEYNQKIEKKDKEIEEFLNFCKSYPH